MKNLQLKNYKIKLVVTPGIMPSFHRRTMAMPALIPNRETDMLIPLMIKFQYQHLRSEPSYKDTFYQKFHGKNRFGW